MWVNGVDEGVMWKLFIPDTGSCLLPSYLTPRQRISNVFIVMYPRDASVNNVCSQMQVAFVMNVHYWLIVKIVIWLDSDSISQVDSISLRNVLYCIIVYVKFWKKMMTWLQLFW